MTDNKYLSLEDEGLEAYVADDTPAPDSESLIGAIDALYASEKAEADSPKSDFTPNFEVPDFSNLPKYDPSRVDFKFTPIDTSASDEEVKADIPPADGDRGEKIPKSNSAPLWEQYAHSTGEKIYRRKEKEKNKFREKFRVLKKGAETDSPILESDEDKKVSRPTDDLSPEENEDIFAAAERSQKKKKKSGIFTAESKSAENLRKKAKEKKSDEVTVSVKAMVEKLTKKGKTHKLQLIALAVLTFVSFVFHLLPSFYAVSNPLEPIFANGGKVYGIINIVLLVLIAAVAYDRFWSGLRSFVTMRFVGSTGLVILFILVLTHDTYSIAKGVCGLGGNDLYTLYAAFAFLVSVVTEMLKNRICIGNLAIVAQGTVMDSINSVEDSADTRILARDIFGREDKLLYCAGTDSIKNLREDMGMRSSEKGFYPMAYTLVLVAAAVCGIILGIRSGFTNTVTGLVACACLCAPTVCELSRIILLYVKNSQLNARGGAVLDYSGTEQMGTAKGIVMDVSDIFTAEVVKYKAAPKLFVREGEVPILTAALLKHGGSMLYPCFFYEAERRLAAPLPLAENIEYIPRAGLKGKVGTHTVLVGTRELMLKNKVATPGKEKEAANSKGGAMHYIAIDGHICAYFIVNYEVRNSIKSASADFGRTGLVLFLSSKEPSLGENAVAEKLRVDVHCVKLISGDGGNIMEEYRRNKSMRALSSLVCARKKKFVFNLAVWAQRFYDADRLVFGANIVGQVIFFLLMITAAFMNIGVFFSPIVIILLHCFWGALSVLPGILKR